MNTLMMIIVVLVAFCYFGGKYCPLVLKKNKEILLGVAGGLVLCSFFGLRLEGWGAVRQGSTASLSAEERDAMQTKAQLCNGCSAYEEASTIPNSNFPGCPCSCTQAVCGGVSARERTASGQMYGAP